MKLHLIVILKSCPDHWSGFFCCVVTAILSVGAMGRKVMSGLYKVRGDKFFSILKSYCWI